MFKRKSAKIVRVTDGGLSYVVLDNSKLVAFEFGRIKGYKGEIVKEM